MLSAEEAVKIGLVDDVVAPELVFEKSVETALKFAAMPSDARHKSKVEQSCAYVDILFGQAFCISLE
jgi:enoyl-CoA hydratase/carnithine racemase